VNFEHHEDDKMRITLSGCDEQTVRYSFTKLAHRYFLTGVKRSDGFKEKYIYEPTTLHNKKHQCQQLIRKEQPEGRYLDIEYYHREKYEVGGNSFKIKSLEDPRHGRVMQLKAPVGSDGEAVVTQTFVYDIEERVTHVYDAASHLTDYTYDEHDRLKSILEQEYRHH
jgi:YD repeat-containing protein